MTTLTFNPVESSGDFTCPPKDTYILELVEIGQMENRLAFGSETVTNTQSRFTFSIVEHDYDPDYDEQNWNGTLVSDYYVFFKEDSETKRRSETWCHEKSKAYPMLAALLGKEPEKGDNIDLQALVGKRMKATVEPKESGYPKISNPIKYRPRRRRDDDDAEEPKANPFKRDADAA